MKNSTTDKTQNMSFKHPDRSQLGFTKISSKTLTETQVDEKGSPGFTKDGNFTGDEGTNQCHPSTDLIWCKGDTCMAPYSGDDKYYEAVVEKIYRKSSPFRVKVKYVGYESEEEETVVMTCLQPRLSTTDHGRNSKESFNAKAEVIRSLVKAKERDQYMRQKYDSSDDGTVLDIAIKKKMGNSKENTSQVSKKEEEAILGNVALTRHTPVGKPEKDAHAFQGFTDSDLEKPRIEIAPVAEKCDFCLSKDGGPPHVKVPALINQYLRDYQRDGIVFMYNHLIKGEGCILADDMGLGKTVQVIALIAAIFGKTGKKQDAMPSYLKRNEEQKEEKQRRGTFLIVSPSSILFNWEDELNTWGYFKTGRFHGASKNETLDKARNGTLEVVLTTYETYRIHIDSIMAVNWLCVVMDEAHRIKEPNSQITKAAKKLNLSCRIGLTGTPMQNNMEELWCLLDWANPDCLGPLDVFRENFAIPIKLGQRFDATKRELAIARKRQQEFGFFKEKWMLRRTKSFLSNQLPRKDERAVFVPLTELQCSLYQQILAFPSALSLISSNDPCECNSGRARAACCYNKLAKEELKSYRKEAFHIITLLRKVANHAGLLLPYHGSSERQQELALSVCKMLFAKFPVLEDVYRNCSFTKMTDPTFSGKLKITDQLLSAMRRDKDKVLIFSTSVQLINILEAYIISKGYVYKRLDGNTKSEARVTIVREFNNHPDVLVCLLSTKAGGQGLNFTGANVVIVFDPSWNPALDNQAEDRAYRIGQHRNVKVYRLIAAGCIEENIYLRQIYKQQLSNIAIHTTNERRLFTAVAGVKRKQGELFGIKNLLMLRKEGSNLTKDLLERTEVIESGVKVVDYEVEANLKDISKLQNTSDDIMDGLEEAATQNLDDFSSDFEEDVNDTGQLFSDEDEVLKDSSNLISIDSPLCEENIATGLVEDAAPLNWDKGRKLERRRRSRHVTCINESKKNDHISSSSDVDTKNRSQCKQEKEKECWKKPLCFSKNELRKEFAESSERMDEILDNFGVTYTSTATKVISKRSAEDKMTSEAIKDVFWHGLRSQEPAHFVAQSASEETDDVVSSIRDPATRRISKPETFVDSKVKEETASPSSLSKRIFERIGSDMFLIGGTPPLIRKQQFNEITQHYGFESSLDFARNLIEMTDSERQAKLCDFYKAKEPSIVNSSAFRRIYCTRSTTRESLTVNFSKVASTKALQSLNRGSCKPKRIRDRMKWRRGRLSVKKNEKVNDSCLLIDPQFRDFSDHVDEASSADMYGTMDGTATGNHGVSRRRSRVKEGVTIESRYDSNICNVSKSSSELEPHFDEKVSSLASLGSVGETQLAMHEPVQVSSSTAQKVLRRFSNELEHDASAGDQMFADSSDGVLHDMMFGPVPFRPCSNEPAQILTKSDDVQVRDSTAPVNDYSPENSPSFSILDELMDKGSTAVSQCKRVSIRTEDLTNASSPLIDDEKITGFCENETQDSPSVLDELM